ncbi:MULTISPECIES: ABC transporter ATP-binding protein [unclassified Rhizobium]|jgi:ABC-type sugar transport system ATPase subunit|uniref:ABC transporter ATP-binding protein n=1 Tax=unclassified Rhizobium TaxID=2613769 RepID=UPI0009DFF53B|nr:MULTISPECIES: ABC transporter ATP-binding protein [unclassified Rhizobium]MBN8954493.1 ABC transporter ATP-binding protein [Rhizobium tropici]RKD72762.1 sn-glycerol 3-phosphate transport system ATP-binding protein/multiple sugar transport system ATP-binding protein/multiple sugar transport system ATP-binding protein [Rhizobium sp. WW_1]
MTIAMTCGATGVSAPQAVTVHGLTKLWPGAQRPVFDQLDVNCPAGGVTVIVGPSGCGKTTLLRCLCGLETATSGTIRFGERDVTQVDPQRRGVAMVFQNYALYPAKTVFENIAFPLRMAGLGKPEIDRRVRAAAQLARIDTLLERLPAQLSGGQRQRVGIARAIVRGPGVLLMDEPLSNLDTKLRIEMRAELASLQREIGATTVYVTHDQTEALALADHLVVMRDGHIEQQGKPETIFSQPANSFVADFLGSMNLAPVEIEEGRSKIGGEDIHLPTSASPLQKFILGFRSEDVRLVSEGEGLRLTALVRRSELMGVERLIHLECGGWRFRARLAEALEPGASVDLFVAAERLHYFDANGHRMENRT